jgi:hypothetical protein
MTRGREVILSDPKQAHRAVLALWEWVKPLLTEGKRYVLELREDTRSAAQNRLLHSRIGDIAKQLDWVGKRRSVDTWKRLLTAAWLRARGEHVEILPALDGHGVDVVFRHTSELSRAECVELSDFILAWGDEREVKWRPASLGREWNLEREHA